MRNENYWSLRLHKLCNRKCCERTNRRSGNATRLVAVADRRTDGVERFLDLLSPLATQVIISTIHVVILPNNPWRCNVYRVQWYPFVFDEIYVIFCTFWVSLLRKNRTTIFKGNLQLSYEFKHRTRLWQNSQTGTSIYEREEYLSKRYPCIRQRH